ncbi:hypothetical protein [Agromyces bauzanensis]|uniref:Uncharacterized protein n=1 Tax=Agromyces bauzanensis TaxID=1308924 RepID=A0A917PV96_9MICO|nr:hypothetical protein [Agromyces bauzanensis]GGJ93149.1 hypothetical protein GCM10011372_34590 [Agromyces bauzanensis]
MPKRQQERDARRAAKRAVKDAERSAKETRSLASSLPREVRPRVDAFADVERARIRRAKDEVGRSPRRARRDARVASARLERMAVRYGTAGGRASSRDASRRGGAPKAIRRQRVQVKQAKSMGVVTGLRTLFVSVFTPTDRKAQQKVAKRRARRVKFGTA